MYLCMLEPLLFTQVFCRCITHRSITHVCLSLRVCVYVFVCVSENPLWSLFAISMIEHTAASQDKLGQQ